MKNSKINSKIKEKIKQLEQEIDNHIKEIQFLQQKLQQLNFLAISKKGGIIELSKLMGVKNNGKNNNKT